MSAAKLAVPVQFPTIYVQVQGGLVTDVLNVPEGMSVVIIDHDIQQGGEEITVSPLDGEACTMRRFG